VPRPKETVPPRIAALGDERVTELRDRLQRGDSVLKLVALIQEDWGEITDIKADSLKKTLERFRKRIREEMTESIVESAVGKTTSGLLKRMNVMEELEELAIVQKRRFQKVLHREEQGPLLMKQVSEEARLFQGLLGQLATLQLETGILRRAPKHVMGTMTDPAGHTTEFSWSEEHDKLLEVIDGECQHLQ
jgi:hypothetical protein